MCIIICKPAGVELPPQEELARCFDSNRDGFGMAYHIPGDTHVIVKKGAMTLEGVYSLLSALESEHPTKDMDMLLHFRIATEGAICAANCHPFPVSSNEENLQSTFIRTKIAMAHNGVLTVPRDPVKLEVPKGIPEGAVLCWQGDQKGYKTKKEFVPYAWSDEDWMAWYNCDHGYYSSVYKAGLAAKFSDTQIFIRDFLSPLRPLLLEGKGLELIHQFITGRFAFLTAKGIMTAGSFSESNGRLYSNDSYKPRVTTTTTTQAHQGSWQRRQQEVHPTVRAGSNGLGCFIKCDGCQEWVHKKDTHEVEDMTFCNSCKTALDKVKQEDMKQPETTNQLALTSTEADEYALDYGAWGGCCP